MVYSVQIVYTTTRFAQTFCQLFSTVADAEEKTLRPVHSTEASNRTQSFQALVNCKLIPHS